VLDERALAAYRRRLSELDEDIADARAANDPVRAERSEAERDALVAELGRATGLGGRVRRAGSASERARAAVTKAVRRAVRDISAADAEIGAHLAEHVTTGTHCSYRSGDVVFGL
jgi:hypothetical protein